MPDQVPDEMKRERIERLVDVVQRVANERNRSASAASRKCSSRGRREPTPRCFAGVRVATRRSTSPAPQSPEISSMSPSSPRPRRRCTAYNALLAAWLPRSRDLDWDGCLNVRDLGGHRTEDGGETRYGAVVRADSIRQLTDAGWAAAVDYGVQDGRRPAHGRRARGGSARGAARRRRARPVLRRRRGGVRRGRSRRAAAPDNVPATRAVYLVFLERFRENVAAAIAAVARAPEGGVVVHCMGGKDRTGLVTAFLLHARRRRQRADRRRLRAQRGAAAAAARRVARGGRHGGRARADPAHRCDAGRVDGRRARGARTSLRERRGVPSRAGSDGRGSAARARAAAWLTRCSRSSGRRRAARPRSREAIARTDSGRGRLRRRSSALSRARGAHRGARIPGAPRRHLRRRARRLGRRVPAPRARGDRRRPRRRPDADRRRRHRPVSARGAVELRAAAAAGRGRRASNGRRSTTRTAACTRTAGCRRSIPRRPPASTRTTGAASSARSSSRRPARRLRATRCGQGTRAGRRSSFGLDVPDDVLERAHSRARRRRCSSTVSSRRRARPSRVRSRGRHGR